MVMKRDKVMRGVSISIVILIGVLCLQLGWSAHASLSIHFQRNVTITGMFFELYRIFDDPTAFLSFIGSVVLIVIKVIWTLKNKRQGEKKN